MVISAVLNILIMEPLVVCYHVQAEHVIMAVRLVIRILQRWRRGWLDAYRSLMEDILPDVMDVLMFRMFVVHQKVIVRIFPIRHHIHNVIIHHNGDYGLNVFEYFKKSIKKATYRAPAR